MTDQTWRQCFFAITLLAIAGLALVIVSGFWHVMAVIVAAAAVVLIWRVSRH